MIIFHKTKEERGSMDPYLELDTKAVWWRKFGELQLAEIDLLARLRRAKTPEVKKALEKELSRVQNELSVKRSMVLM